MQTSDFLSIDNLTALPCGHKNLFPYIRTLNCTIDHTSHRNSNRVWTFVRFTVTCCL